MGDGGDADDGGDANDADDIELMAITVMMTTMITAMVMMTAMAMARERARDMQVMVGNTTYTSNTPFHVLSSLMWHPLCLGLCCVVGHTCLVHCVCCAKNQFRKAVHDNRKHPYIAPSPPSVTMTITVTIYPFPSCHFYHHAQLSPSPALTGDTCRVYARVREGLDENEYTQRCRKCSRSCCVAEPLIRICTS